MKSPAAAAGLEWPPDGAWAASIRSCLILMLNVVKQDPSTPYQLLN